MSSNNSLISVRGTIVRETEKAVLFSVEDISGESLNTPVDKWFPLSQVEKRVISKNSGEDTMMISSWIAEKLELI